MFKRNTIFSKLFFSYSFIIIISFVLFIAVFFYLFHLHLYSEYEEKYQYQSGKLEKLLQNEDRNNGKIAEGLEFFLEQVDYQIFLLDEKGSPIMGDDPMLSNDILNKVTAGEKIAEGGFYNGELRYIIASKFPSQIQGIDEPVMVMIFHNLTHEYQQVIMMILITFSIAILFAGVILWFISRRITAPLREMNDIARFYAKGDFSKSVQYESNDEIGQLAKSFTYMAEELNHLEKRRNQYISNLSHELRSPLTSIKGFIIALIDGAIPENRRSHYYRIMKDETERMIKLVNDTLEMNQLEEGNSNLVRSDYNVNEQLRWIIHKLEPHVNQKNLDIVLKAESDFYVYADKEKMEQVFINLLQNAIQFSNQDGKIDLYLGKEGNNVRVSIQDYGEGIEEDQINLIWRRFYKVDESRTNKSGAGLGLAIVKSILDLHNSEIKVESKVGEGTVFSFLLPLSK